MTCCASNAVDGAVDVLRHAARRLAEDDHPVLLDAAGGGSAVAELGHARDRTLAEAVEERGRCGRCVAVQADRQRARFASADGDSEGDSASDERRVRVFGSGRATAQRGGRERNARTSR